MTSSTIRAAVTVAPNEMQVQDVAAPTAGEGQLLVDVEAVGLCGSDFHLYDGHHPYASYPRIQGHEFVGRLASTGERPDLSVGDRVVVEPLLECGHCFACRRGRYNCCENLRVVGAHVDGGLRERLAVRADRVHPVGDMPVLTAVLVEPVTIGLQTLARADVTAADTVVALGAGPIGLAVTLGAADRGARVLVVDRVPSRLEFARRFGAEVVVDGSTTDVAAAIDTFTGGDGATVVVEATGVPALIRQALDVVAYSGTVVIVGISDAEVSIPVGLFSRKEVTVLGSRNNAGLFPTAIELVGRHADVVSALVTHTFPLTDAPEALEFAMNHPHEVGKAVVTVTPTEDDQ